MSRSLTAEGVFLHQRGQGYAAQVTVSMLPTAALPSIRLACSGRLAQAQGELEEATLDGYADWKAGAVVGIHFALLCAKHTTWQVTVTRIIGLTTDTNPTIVAAAAMRAVWQILAYTPSDAERTYVEQMAFTSWDRAPDEVPLLQLP